MATNILKQFCLATEQREALNLFKSKKTKIRNITGFIVCPGYGGLSLYYFFKKIQPFMKLNGCLFYFTSNHNLVVNASAPWSATTA